jgi:hypothetical protein
MPRPGLAPAAGRTTSARVFSSPKLDWIDARRILLAQEYRPRLVSPAREAPSIYILDRVPRFCASSLFPRGAKLSLRFRPKKYDTAYFSNLHVNNQSTFVRVNVDC